MNQKAFSWLIWVLAAAVLTMVARNPLYAIIILVVSRFTLMVFDNNNIEWTIPFWRIAGLILVVSALYNALFVHLGATVIFELPDWPLVGGVITAEAIVAGIVNGLILVTLLAVFLVLNRVVPTNELTRLTPASLRDFGVVVLIALTYVPETVLHYGRIREAQAIRGQQLKGYKAWRPLVIPLLIGGLERAMRLAESMVARGYGATVTVEHGYLQRIALTAGFGLALAGWLIALWVGWLGWILVLAGTLLIFGLLHLQSKRSPVTTYIAHPWTPIDVALILSSVFALMATLIPWPFVDQTTVSYSSFPQVTLPGIDLIIVIALAGLALPALMPGAGAVTGDDTD